MNAVLTCTGKCGTQREPHANEFYGNPGKVSNAWCLTCRKMMPHLVGRGDTPRRTVTLDFKPQHPRS